MTEAETILGQIADLDLDASRKLAFDRCTVTHECEYGYGPAKEYEFADGSTLTEDGRGFTAA